MPQPGEPRGDWTDQENDLIVADYFQMLSAELAGQQYSKAEHRRGLSSLLPARPEGSIEFKHQNISAVLLGLGQPWMAGYKPAKNFQLPLVDAVLRWLDSRSDWLNPSANEGLPRLAAVSDYKPIWIGPPPTIQNAPSPVDPKLLQMIGRKVDVAARDARNRALGVAGEEQVLHHEWATLRAAGRADLAKKVRWTSKEDGEGFGFDISSFEADGRDRLIEVKTTNGWERTPFHITANELGVANQRRDVWCLLRIYDFARTPRAFEIRLPLERHVELTPTTFLAGFERA